ncbi:MAG: hypothetical protein ACK4NC_07020 [Candidatus Gracilibacteria bacterium]
MLEKSHILFEVKNQALEPSTMEIQNATELLRTRMKFISTLSEERKKFIEMMEEYLKSDYKMSS